MEREKIHPHGLLRAQAGSEALSLTPHLMGPLFSTLPPLRRLGLQPFTLSTHLVTSESSLPRASAPRGQGLLWSRLAPGA